MNAERHTNLTMRKNPTDAVRRLLLVAGGGEKCFMINRARLRGVTNHRRPARISIQRDSRSRTARRGKPDSSEYQTTQPLSHRPLGNADEAMTGHHFTSQIDSSSNIVLLL